MATVEDDTPFACPKHLSTISDCGELGSNLDSSSQGPAAPDCLCNGRPATSAPPRQFNSGKSESLDWLIDDLLLLASVDSEPGPGGSSLGPERLPAGPRKPAAAAGKAAARRPRGAKGQECDDITVIRAICSVQLPAPISPLDSPFASEASQKIAVESDPDA